MAFDIFISSPDVGPAEEQAVQDAMRSGWIAPLGPMVDAFEEEMAARIGVSYSVALSSGTASLHMALLGIGVGAGDVVVTSTMTFSATANAIVYTGAKPFFVDVDPVTGCMDPGLLAEALELLRRTGQSVKAVMPVDLLGRAADYTRIEPLVASYGIDLVPDSAEALGASHGGRAVGSFGRASGISFNGNKIMTTSGGGMLLTDDGDLASRVRYLATQARQPVVWYEHTDIGYNYRMSNILASLGRAQLSRLDAMMAKRWTLRERYKAFWADVPGGSVFAAEGDEHDNAWLTSILVDPADAGFSSEDLRLYLADQGIESRPLWKAMHLQPVFSDMPALVTGAAQRLFETGLTLPSGSVLTEPEIERVFTALAGYLKEKK
jgi:dTDP-4-amino-4,6-dideoxygalactose transaminase